MNKPLKILVMITGWDATPWIAAFREAMPQSQLVLHTDPHEKRGLHYALAWKPPTGLLAQYPDLKAIFSLGAGVDHMLADTQLPDVPIARVVDPNLTQQMTEWVVWQVLQHHRQFRLYDAQQKEHVWKDHRDQPSASEVRVGIMGMGELGQDAARILTAMGFQVAGWSRKTKSIDNITVYAGNDQLDAFLARTDILVSLLPLTPETRGILNYNLARKLARDGRLPKPALINAGRGGLQIETDLLRALNDGTLGGISLDVFETEPLPTTSPLWDHPNVFITPHNAAISNPRSIAQLLRDQIARVENGTTLLHQVHKSRGY